MSNSTKYMLTILVMVLASGCATTQTLDLPEPIMQVNPNSECQEYSSADAWNMRARIVENEEVSYLVIYFKPPYQMYREPRVELVSGIAIYEGLKDHNYFYKIGKLPNSIKVGRVSFETRNRIVETRTINGRIETDAYNRYDTLMIERYQGTDCLKLIAPVTNTANF